MSDNRDTSNRLNFEFEKIESSSYAFITKAVVEKFGLEIASKLVQGFDEVFQDFKQGDKVVGLEWDIWSGYMVVAKRTVSEPLVREIAEYISANHDT